jgi:hypothetical protein
LSDLALDSAVVVVVIDTLLDISDSELALVDRRAAGPTRPDAQPAPPKRDPNHPG